MNPQALLEENTSLRHQVTLQGDQIKLLQEQLDWFKRQLFGKRSEKIIDNPNQLSLELELEQITQELKEQTIAAHKRRKQAKGKDKLTLPDNLPVETKILDLPKEEKTCLQTGQPLVKIGEEISRKLAHKPGSYYIKEIIRPKYALPNNEGIAIHPMPEGIIPSLHFSPLRKNGL